MSGFIHLTFLLSALVRFTLRAKQTRRSARSKYDFPSYALENPGVWGWPQGALIHHHSKNGNRKFTIFAILLLPKIKTVADPFFLLLFPEVLRIDCNFEVTRRK